MANTYTQIYIQVVFAVQGRYNLIRKELKEELHKYITGIIRNKKQKLIAINNMPDHAHIFIGMKPSIALSDLVRDIKNNSSTFINEKKMGAAKIQLAGRFRCIFIRPFPNGCCCKIHSEPGGTSRQEDLQRGIHGIA